MNDEQGFTDADPRPKCDHICLKDDGHVERGEPHFYGYEIPSPRALRYPGPAIVHHPDGTVTEHGWTKGEVVFGTCDWGVRDEPAVGYMFDHAAVWALPVCVHHLDGGQADG